jgi:hypothetical protein
MLTCFSRLGSVKRRVHPRQRGGSGWTTATGEKQCRLLDGQTRLTVDYLCRFLIWLRAKGSPGTPRCFFLRISTMTTNLWRTVASPFTRSDSAMRKSRRCYPGEVTGGRNSAYYCFSFHRQSTVFARSNHHLRNTTASGLSCRTSWMGLLAMNFGIDTFHAAWTVADLLLCRLWRDNKTRHDGTDIARNLQC